MNKIHIKYVLSMANLLFKLKLRLIGEWT